MRKYCFIGDTETNKCYCSKCGCIVLQDDYNMKKYADSCDRGRYSCCTKGFSHRSGYLSSADVGTYL